MVFGSLIFAAGIFQAKASRRKYSETYELGRGGNPRSQAINCVR
jgi:hypothetical protein